MAAYETFDEMIDKNVNVRWTIRGLMIVFFLVGAGVSAFLSWII